MSSLNHPALGNLGNKTDPADQVQATGRRPKKKATLSRSLASKALILGRGGPSEEERQNPP